MTKKDDHQLEPIIRKDGTQSLPARGYSWEPFVPGHVKSMVHGARSERVVEAVAKIVTSDVVAAAPWLIEPVFGDALERYARAEARSRLLTDHILRTAEEQGAEKIPVRLWESASAADNTAAKAAADLGLTPLARARLAALTTSTEVAAQSLDTLADRGAAVRRRRAAAIESESEGDE